MSKKRDFYEEAERLYTIEQMTFNEIASRLELSEKCLRNWGEEGNWSEKRRSYLVKKQSFHEELYDFGRELMKSIKTDMAEGKEVNPGRLYAFTRILPMIDRVKKYEDTKLEKEKELKPAEKLTEEDVKYIVKEVLNLEL